MPLQPPGTFIDSLSASDPVGSTDKVQTLDDHIREIIGRTKASFPNVSGAMTATHTELNVLDGITATTAELNILDGVTLTASQINDAALKSNVENVFLSSTDTGSFAQTVRNTNATAGAFSAWIAGNGTSLVQLIQTGTGSTLSGIGVTGAPASGGACLALSANAPLVFATQNTSRLEIGGTGNFDFKSGTITATGALSLSGTLTTPNTSASEVGFKGTPPNAQNGDYTLALTDAGKTIYKASGGAGETITIPANGTVAFPVGTIVRVVNNGGGDLSIAITTDTLSLAGAGTTGTRTLSDHGVAVLEKVATTEWFISGVGVS